MKVYKSEDKRILMINLCTPGRTQYGVLCAMLYDVKTMKDVELNPDNKSVNVYVDNRVQTVNLDELKRVYLEITDRSDVISKDNEVEQRRNKLISSIVFEEELTNEKTTNTRPVRKPKTLHMTLCNATAKIDINL